MHRLQGIARVESPEHDLVYRVSNAGGPLAQLLEGRQIIEERRLGQEIFVGQPGAKSDDVGGSSIDEVSYGQG